MRRVYPDAIEAGRELAGRYATARGDQHGRFLVRCERTGARLLILAAGADAWRREMPPTAAGGLAWEHVSVSAKDRCPTWAEMCWAKDQFFGAEECVVEYHPPKSAYVNNHPFVLHLWRPVGVEIPMPPTECV